MARSSRFLPLLAAILLPLAFGATLNNYLDARDVDALKNVFRTALSSPSDLAAVHYGIGGLKSLGEQVPDGQKLCEFAKSRVDANDVESLYHVSGVAALVPSCQIPLPKATETLSAIIGDESKTVQDLYYAASALSHLKQKVDSAKLSKALTAGLKKDDGVNSLAYAFHAAILLETPTDLQTFFDRIEETVAQADEVDGKFLQFEGGLSVTAVAVSGIYHLAEKVAKAPSVKGEEVVKFANYLLSRKGVRLVRPAFHLLRALKALAGNKFHVPVAFTRVSGVSVTPGEASVVKVKVSDVLGGSLGSLTVTLDTATHLASSGVVANKKAMTAAPTDNTVYQLDFLEVKREKGFYKLVVGATSATDKRLVGTQGAEVSVKVPVEIAVHDAEVSIVDREQTSGGKPVKASFPSKLSTALEADFHQKLSMKFTVKEKNGAQAVAVHQAFVIFTSDKTEAIFVAEADSAKVYRFDVDLQKAAKEFEYLGGQYKMKLVIGDAAISNPISWEVADVRLKFPDYEKPAKSPLDEVIYEKRPEIQHLFREPEKRPPQIVSDTFTILTLVPLALLLIFWLRIGANLSGFPVSLYAIGFHLGLIGIFGLYLVFWLRLNMFQTLKYLAIVGAFTLICGNRMLRGMADARKTKTE